MGPRSAPRPGRVLVVGDIMTDIIVVPRGAVRRGSDSPATIRSLPGGSAANQAVWLAHFGVPVTLAARVGAADLDQQQEALLAAGVTPRLGSDPARPTGRLVTLVDPDGERSFLTDRGANAALGPADLPDGLLDEAALLHLSGYALVDEEPRAAVLALMARARGRGIPVTLDPGSAGFLADIGPASFLAWTRGADLLVPNAEEAALLAGTGDATVQRRVLAGHYGAVVIKRGAEGAEHVGPDGALLHRCDAPRAAVVDPTGAGDAFLAAYLAGLLADAAPPERLAAAVAAGTKATTTLGGRPTGTAPAR